MPLDDRLEAEDQLCVRILERCKAAFARRKAAERGFSMNRLSEALGAPSNATISRIFADPPKQVPSLKTLIRLASALNVDLRDVERGVPRPYPLPDSEVGETVPVLSRPVPVAGYVAADPSSRVVWENDEEPTAWLRLPRDARALEIRGSSMWPILGPGQHVVVSGLEADNGDLAVVTLADGRQVFKHFALAGGRVVLTSEDGEPPMVLDPSEVVEARKAILGWYTP